ncbi:TonB-dependent receptor domain-containing protein, partial [Mycobacterium tuberculosis]
YALTAATADNNIAGNYGVKENIYAGYAMAAWHGDRLRVIAGVRYELTDFESSSLTRSSFVSPATYTPARHSSSYGNVLPSFNASYDLTDTVKVRAA